MARIWNNMLRFFSELGIEETDSTEDRLKKNILVVSYIVAVLAAIFFVTLFVFSGELLGGGLLFLGALGASISFVDLVRTREYSRFQFVMFFIYLTVPLAVTWSFGGFNHAGLIIIWSFLSPTLALMTSTLKKASSWFLAYLGLLILSGFIQPFLSYKALFSEGLISAMLIVNLGLTTFIIFSVLRYFIAQKNIAYALLAIEQEKSDTLLLNVLPRKIANILKEKDETIADHFEETSILFADLVGFSSLSAKLKPVALVELLNEIFSKFDEVTDKYGLEKIGTIGDNYMVASGVPDYREDHAQALVEFALDMRHEINLFKENMADSIDFRIGINSGPLVAGVIGKKKFKYDVWGDTVNIASRMESHGAAGKIHVTNTTYQILKDDYIFEERGRMQIKGMGEMETWFLISRK